tara:strand:- start:739 stop:1230 length:492 start_codon:yes stop_codon:yes gene_type:complete
VTIAYIGIGSNLGNRVENLHSALRLIDGIMTLEQLSGTYETAPKYVLDQPPFLNMAIGGETLCKPLPLLEMLKRFELEIGREPSEERYGPRVIDLDILFYGNDIVNMPGLSIPHPFIAEREFVLRPLAEIAPDHRHPVLNQTVSELLSLLKGASEAQVFSIDV